MPAGSPGNRNTRFLLPGMLLLGLAAAAVAGPAAAWEKRHTPYYPPAGNPYGLPYGSGIWSWLPSDQYGHGRYFHTVPVPLWSHDSRGWYRPPVSPWQQHYWQQQHWQQQHWQQRHWQQHRPGSAYYYQGGRLQLWP